MIEIQYWDVLESSLLSLTKDGLMFVGEKIKKILQNYLKKNWYNVSSPMFYQRTFEVLNSITVKEVAQVGNEVEVEIFFDETKIISKESTFQLYGHMKRFNHHMSINHDTGYNGADIGIALVYWMNYGQNSSLHAYSGASFLEDTLNEISVKKTHLVELERAFKKVGIYITHTW